MSTPKSYISPSSAEAFKKINKKWAQWYASLDSGPQPLDPRNYGWEADNPNRTL